MQPMTFLGYGKTNEEHGTSDWDISAAWGYGSWRIT